MVQSQIVAVLLVLLAKRSVFRGRTPFLEVKVVVWIGTIDMIGIGHAKLLVPCIRLAMLLGALRFLNQRTPRVLVDGVFFPPARELVEVDALPIDGSVK